MGRDSLLRLEAQLRRNRLPPIYDAATHWYQDWYFRLRLEEERARSIRYGYNSSLIVFELLHELGGPLAPARVDFNAALTRIPARLLRRSDIPGLVDAERFGVCLPHTPKEKAEVVAERLAHELSHYRMAVRLCDLQDDDLDLQSLFERSLTDPQRLPRG